MGKGSARDQTIMAQLMQGIEYLTEIRGLLRHYAPNFDNIEKSDEKEIQKRFQKVAKLLVPIFEKERVLAPFISTEIIRELGYADKNSSINETNQSISDKKERDQAKIRDSDNPKIISSSVELMEIIEGKYVFVASNSIKKKLKSLGIEPRLIIVAGGPITIDDLKEKNPNIPEASLKGYQKKIDRVFNDLKKAAERKKNKPIIFLQTMLAETDEMIEKRLDEISQKFNIKFIRYLVKNWDF